MHRRECMNLASHLNFCEKKLNTLPTRQKIQLFFIPICLMILMVYNFVDFNRNISLNPITELKKNEINFYNFLTKLQEFSLKNGLNIVNIKQNDINISLEAQGDFLDLVQLLIFCETYNSVNTIESLKFTKKEDTPYLLLTFSFAQHHYEVFEKDKQNTQMALQNPFNKYDVSEATNPLPIKLYAIINDEVLINHTWLKQGEQYLDYEIFKINPHSVILKNASYEYEELHLNKE